MSLPSTIPLVVQVGFAGSRTLFASSPHPDFSPEDLETQVFDALAISLDALPVTLGLSPHHLLSGVSQIAVGADTLFTRACQKCGVAQRVLLPQHRDEYLLATSQHGVPDFTPEQQRAALTLLSSPHIIEERVVSNARDRTARFEETNTAILHASDVVICLVREAAGGRVGGTEDLIRQAQSSGKPVARITVSIVDGRAVLSPLRPLKEWTNGGDYVLPRAPAELPDVAFAENLSKGEWPTAASFIAAIKVPASQQSDKHSGWFKRSAIFIIAFHLAATLLAILAGKLQETIAPILLSAELLLLIVGLTAHFRLHHTAHARVWAVCRLLAETMRSLREVDLLRGDIAYPLDLAVPESLFPLLRTCAVLHLRQDRSEKPVAWTDRRATYIERRLTNPQKGQISYYKKEREKAERSLNIATSLFWLSSSLAIVATVTELLRHFDILPVAMGLLADQWGNALAIILPVAAVGFLSWAAASDLEARVQTFTEMQAFLDKQRKKLEAAASEAEFNRLVRETEPRLLGETLNWYWRRSFTGVS